MAITQYEKGGQKLWKVYVHVRSAQNPAWRKQKLLVGIDSEHVALSEEKKLLRTLSHEVAKLEGRGYSWKEIVDRWELTMQGIPGRYARSTIDDHSAMLRRWSEPWLDRRASELTCSDGRALMNWLERDRGISKTLTKRVMTDGPDRLDTEKSTGPARGPHG